MQVHSTHTKMTISIKEKNKEESSRWVASPALFWTLSIGLYVLIRAANYEIAESFEEVIFQ